VFSSHLNSLPLVITYTLNLNVPPPKNLSLFSRQTEVSSSRVCFSVQYVYAAPRIVALYGAVHWVVTVGKSVRNRPGACIQLRDILAEHGVEMDAEGGG